MVQEFLIENMRETPDAFYISGKDGKEHEIFKTDLGSINLGKGNLVTVFHHPSFPSIVSRLDLSGHCVFSKTREEINDEWIKSWKTNLLGQLPKSAKHLLKMFEMFVPEFRLYELAEITALQLGADLFRELKHEQLIENFPRVPRESQLLILPSLKNPMMATASMEVVAKIAKAFLRDREEQLDCEKITDLPCSKVMRLSNATAERYGEFCQPRPDYIAKYMAAIY